MSGSILNDQVAAAEVYADVPRVDVIVAQAVHATRDCKAAPPKTPSDEIFLNLTHVVPTLSYDWGYNVTDLGVHDFSLGNRTMLATACLAYLPSVTALGPVPSKSKQNAAGSVRSQLLGARGVFFTAMVAFLALILLQ